MNWSVFSSAVSAGKCSLIDAAAGRMAAVLGDAADIATVGIGNHAWYPLGIENQQKLNGFRYVDMDHSYCGTEPILLSEGSNCMILILIDPHSPLHFATHISATSIDNRLFFRTMQTNLYTFFSRIGFDMGRPNVYMFSENLYKGGIGTYEQANVMALLSAVLAYKRTALLADESLRWLAFSTYLIEGENHHHWNSYCSIRIQYEEAKHKLLISFAST